MVFRSAYREPVKHYFFTNRSYDQRQKQENERSLSIVLLHECNNLLNVTTLRSIGQHLIASLAMGSTVFLAPVLGSIFLVDSAMGNIL